MAMRGTKPTPTLVKRLTGNPGKRRLNTAEPQPPPLEEADFLEPPSELAGAGARAAAEWRRLAPMLRRVGQITAADRSALVALCLEWDRYLEAMRQVRRRGLIVLKRSTGEPRPNPYLTIALKSLASCQKLWPELGLTPSSRSRVQREGPPIGGDAFSEFDRPPMLGSVKR